MVALMLVFIAVGGYVGGEQGMMIAFLMAAGMNIFSYFFNIDIKRYILREIPLRFLIVELKNYTIVKLAVSSTFMITEYVVSL